MRRLPPLPAIRAFEAAARHLSFRIAAEELCVTPSAISHQVRSLEAHLGRSLFRREGGRITLMEAGRQYLGDLTNLLDGLDASTRKISEAAPGPFVVLCTPGFASRWLVPRLDQCPLTEQIEIEVSAGAPSTDFAVNGADLVVQWSAELVPGVVTEPMMESVRYPVATPELAARIQCPADLLNERLLYAEVADAWEAWFRLAKLDTQGLPAGPRLPHCELSLSAAERGQGVTLAYDAMARGALREGKLVRLFNIEVPAVTMYSVAYSASRKRCPEIRILRDWMFDEVKAEGTLADHAQRATPKDRVRRSPRHSHRNDMRQV